MADSAPPSGRPSTTGREWISYVIELPIVVSTESYVRIESATVAPRWGTFSDERTSVDQSNVSHSV
jgi:hypothetical protein